MHQRKLQILPGVGLAFLARKNTGAPAVGTKPKVVTEPEAGLKKDTGGWEVVVSCEGAGLGGSSEVPPTPPRLHNCATDEPGPAGAQYASEQAEGPDDKAGNGRAELNRSPPSSP